MSKRGRPIDMKSVMKVQKYLKKGLNEAEIARVMRKTRQQVNRWVQYVKKGLVDAEKE